MSIPLDRLYQYIESVAVKNFNNNVLIYRFFPHGSKKIEDLKPLTEIQTKHIHSPTIICNDQEPLFYHHYQNVSLDQTTPPKSEQQNYHKLLHSLNVDVSCYNLRAAGNSALWNIYDQCVLLHSEKRSKNVGLYHDNGFIPAYYWSHAIIALDWFRYAQHQPQSKSTTTNTFLIYNRAWSGVREYRLKFADLLIDNNLVDNCQTSMGFTDNGIHYNDYKFTNPQWKPTHKLEDFFTENLSLSSYSAEFVLSDYNNTDIEVVLETLFDDDRLHLTEKSLRPIACGQPFILSATHGSLSYLRDYGFKTFDGIIDETYDTIEDPYSRLNAIVDVMKHIANWSDSERTIKLHQLQQIANYNQQHFFSDNFFKLVCNELSTNLATALEKVENTNTCQRWFDLRKLLAKDDAMQRHQTTDQAGRSRQDIVKIVQLAKNYNIKNNKY